MKFLYHLNKLNNVISKALTVKINLYIVKSLINYIQVCQLLSHPVRAICRASMSFFYVTMCKKPPLLENTLKKFNMFLFYYISKTEDSLFIHQGAPKTLVLNGKMSHHLYMLTKHQQKKSYISLLILRQNKLSESKLNAQIFFFFALSCSLDEEPDIVRLNFTWSRRYQRLPIISCLFYNHAYILLFIWF